MRHIVTVDDLEDDEIERIIHDAHKLSDAGGCERRGDDALIALAFFEPSLRTRVGFAAAAGRLGWTSVGVEELRASPTAMPESWQDTMRVIAGYADVVICRSSPEMDRAELQSACSSARLLNAGDHGPAAEHPSQALIDCAAWERMVGPTAELTIGLCGDLRMRAVRSLLALLCRRRPAGVALFTLPPFDEIEVPRAIADLVEWREPWQLDAVDVLYVAGMPHASIDAAVRARLQVDDHALEALAADAVVLSPLPLLDEISPRARLDPRVRMFDQSDLGLWVRVALLNHMVDQGSS